MTWDGERAQRCAYCHRRLPARALTMTKTAYLTGPACQPCDQKALESWAWRRFDAEMAKLLRPLVASEKTGGTPVAPDAREIFEVVSA